MHHQSNSNMHAAPDGVGEHHNLDAAAVGMMCFDEAEGGTGHAEVSSVGPSHFVARAPPPLSTNALLPQEGGRHTGPPPSHTYPAHSPHSRPPVPPGHQALLLQQAQLQQQQQQQQQSFMLQVGLLSFVVLLELLLDCNTRRR